MHIFINKQRTDISFLPDFLNFLFTFSDTLVCEWDFVCEWDMSFRVPGGEWYGFNVSFETHVEI